jgi:hypothetical protein
MRFIAKGISVVLKLHLMRIWIIVVALGALLVGKAGLQCRPNSNVEMCHDLPKVTLSAPAPSAAPADTPVFQSNIATLHTPTSLILSPLLFSFDDTASFRPVLHPPPPR